MIRTLISNWPTLAAGLLYIGQAVAYVLKGNYPMAGAFLFYAAANVCFSLVK